MASVNKWIGIGNLGRDPEMRYTASGEAMCNFSIACTETWKDKQTGEKREMTEWVLPADQLAQYEDVRRDMVHDPRWPGISRFVRGGFWRNYKVKYPEANEMYSRMMMVSRRLKSEAVWTR